MKLRGNEIEIQQGEDWNLDLLLSATSSEYIPYIISNQRQNPMFVITISSSQFDKQNRYRGSWWNDLIADGTPTFYSTTPYYVGEYTSSDSIPSIPPTINGVIETYATRLLYQYTLTTDSIDSDLGHKPYYYYYYDYTYSESTDSYTLGSAVLGYECHIRYNFSYVDTSSWGSQSYRYQVSLVSGEKIVETFYNIALYHGLPSDYPSRDLSVSEICALSDLQRQLILDEQYEYIRRVWPTALQADIESTTPLGTIVSPETIVAPTKLVVYNNLRTLF